MEVLKKITQVRAEAVSSRRPLVRKGATWNPEVKLFNPRFEEDFVAGKDYDPDRCIPTILRTLFVFFAEGASCMHCILHCNAACSSI